MQPEGSLPCCRVSLYFDAFYKLNHRCIRRERWGGGEDSRQVSYYPVFASFSTFSVYVLYEMST
jgi:hypothetical protein